MKCKCYFLSLPKVKKHGRKEISLFRYGLDYIRQILLKFHENQREFYAIVRKTLESQLLLRAYPKTPNALNVMKAQDK